ncbi:Rv3654c family TadE-like protein [Microbacterium testaceum]|uniref:Rv3654c family TadE-like protein n=1 Tax=Microbacterium testaceum TaxID=2033 RepID=UPI001248CFF8|nr:Rv3654c family TadE-like protein [Microbacterium testaceum]
MAGTVATLGVTSVLVGAVAALAVIGGAVITAERVAAVADAAALAAADAASGAVTGVPCEEAERVAAAGAARLRECDVDGLIATITVAGAYGGISFDARSRAGPPQKPRARETSRNPNREACVWCASTKGPQWQTERSSSSSSPRRR